MKRLAFALALMITGSAQALADNLPAQLKANAMIDGEVIRLGDLWDNLGDKGATPIVNAPRPGKRVTLDARWLYAVAQANGVDWRPATQFDRTLVERAGQTIDQATIETQIREALDMEGLPAGTSFELSNRTGLNIVIPAGPQPEIAIRDVQIDRRTQRFALTIEVPANSPSAVRQRVSGRVFSTTRVPVLTRSVSRGDIITENDVEWMEIREENVRRDIAIDPRELVGQEPRFRIKAGTPIRVSELQRPLMVTRNNLVTMILKTPYMTLTAQGKAVEDGGRGDTVKVTNLQTKQVVEAKVEGPGTVSVTFGNPRIVSN